MSARGAEGILAAKRANAAKTSAPPKKDTPPKRVAITDSEGSERVAEAKAAATQKDDTSGAEKLGSQVGQAVGKPIGSTLSVGNQAAGFVLGLLVWGWLVRPFLSGGVAGVKAVMMAKFFNKKPDGTEIP